MNRKNMKTSIMRILRQKYSISLRELAEAANISLQFISVIELGVYPATDTIKAQIVTAFERIIEKRAEVLQDLTVDFNLYRDKLLDFVEDNGKDFP